MSRPFSIHTVLRQIPNHSLRAFFCALGCGDLGLPWEELSERNVLPIIDAICALPRSDQHKVESELHTIFDFACETGLRAILEAAECYGIVDAARQLPEEGTLYAKVMWARMQWPSVMETAARFHQVEQLRWWRKRPGLPAKEPDTSKGTLNLFGKELSRLLLAREGRGRRCTVEFFPRGSMAYFFAFPDDHIQNTTIHDDDGVLAPWSFRQTFQMVFAYNQQTGTLELFAKGPGPLKGQLEALFARLILGHRLEVWRPKAAYSLTHLVRQRFDLATDPEDAVLVTVRSARLDLKNSRRRIILEPDSEQESDNVQRMMEEVLNREHVPIEAVDVSKVTFEFAFQPLDGRKEGTMTFDVAPPNSCNLRTHRPERVGIAQKYLKRWGIDVR
jgi:hypothetical protein